MITIKSFQPDDLFQVQSLVNVHLGALAPGWAVPEATIARLIKRNPSEYIIDPWVIARTTLCAIEQQRIVAVAHTLHYGTGPEVNKVYHNVGEIDWLFAWPDASEAATLLLNAVQQQFSAWGAREAWFNGGSIIGPFTGMPDVWPHLSNALQAAGYTHDTNSDEMVYGGQLDHINSPSTSPLDGLTVIRTSGSFGTRFTALLDNQLVGSCECITDLTDGGAVPSLKGWAELTELEVAPEWQRRGIGEWLVQHIVQWLRFGNCNRIVLAVTAEAEAAGVDRFYKRFDWQLLVRQTKGWSKIINS